FEFERVLRPLCLDRHRFFSLLEFTHSARDSFFGGKVSADFHMVQLVAGQRLRFNVIAAKRELPH
ncbi:hypothetical protein, partial [Paraburkholderia domus]|uniref:hypothetical protein n=1 Tax=Paraburkholderia domus TaxID=2793075 RepID=UPI001EEFB45E